MSNNNKGETNPENIEPQNELKLDLNSDIEKESVKEKSTKKVKPRCKLVV